MKDALCAAFLACALTTVSHAQVTPQLALARVCVAEAGLRVSDDCAAIYQVLQRGARSRRMDFVAYARAYSPHAFDGDGRHPWIAELAPDGEQPPRWPTVRTVRRNGHVEVLPALPWARARRHWVDVYGLAGRILAGTVASSCERPPDHWGCPEDRGRECRDHERAVRAGWVRVACGAARNEFWAIPASQ
jgi:hypothetical protein